MTLALLCWIYVATVRPLRAAAAHAAAIAAARTGAAPPAPAPAERVDEIGAIITGLNRHLHSAVPLPPRTPRHRYHPVDTRRSAGTGPPWARPGYRSAASRSGRFRALAASRRPGDMSTGTSVLTKSTVSSSPGADMTYLFTVYALGCAIALVAGLVEQRRHHRHLHSIPRRIVVNGIRGKSSITRLCAGALRGGGLVTVAKTTGTAARFITPDGTEEPVYRKFGIANIVEQIGIVRRAAAYRPDALVIECMAVLPDLQEINQRKLIQSTICVICNVREDHLAEMGPTLDDVARSLSRSMPAGGICVTAEQDRAAHPAGGGRPPRHRL